MDRPDEPATQVPRNTEAETKALAILEAAAPQCDHSAWVRIAYLDQDPTKLTLDARVACEGLDLRTMKMLRSKVDKAGPWDTRWELRGIDRAADGTQQAGFLCKSLNCKEVDEDLIDPSVVSP